MMLLFDRTGSMTAPETDPETGQRASRFEHSWRYLKHDVNEQIAKGRENLKVFILPFSTNNGMRPVRLPIENDIALNNTLEDLKRRFPPDGATDIVWAMSQALNDLNAMQFGPHSEVQIVLYSDGEQNIWHPNPAKPDPRTEAETERRWDEEVQDEVARLFIFFDEHHLEKNPASGFNVKYWGGKNPVAKALKAHHIGDEDLNKVPPGKADLIALENVLVVPQPDGSAQVNGIWKADFKNVAAAKVDIRATAPYESVTFTQALPNAENATQGEFKLVFPNVQNTAKTNVRINGKIIDAVPGKPEGKVTVGSGTFVSAYIGADPRIYFEYPAEGLLAETFSHLTAGVPAEGVFRFRWNAAAALMPIKIAFPERAYSISIQTADGRTVNEGHFKLGELFGSAQSALLRIKVTGTQVTKAPARITLAEFSSPAFVNGHLEAMVGVYPPGIHFDGIDVSEFQYDSDEMEVTINVLSIKPDAAAGEHTITLSLINQHPERMTADLFVDGQLLKDRNFRVKEPAVASLKLKGKQKNFLKEYKPGDMVVDCGVADTGARMVAGFGFDPGNAAQYPIKVKFIDRPRFFAMLFGPDGKPVSAAASAATLQVGERLQYTLKCNWNAPAIGKKIVHPFAAPLDLRAVKAELEPPILDWRLDDALSRQLLINVTAVQPGDHEPRHVELLIEDSIAAAFDIPPHHVIAPLFEFNLTLVGANREPVKIDQPLLVQPGDQVPFYLLARWSGNAVGKRVTHPLSHPVEYGLARIASESGIGDWTLDSSHNREIPLKLLPMAQGRTPVHKLEFTVESLIALVHVPSLIIYVPTFAIQPADTTPLLLDGNSVSQNYVLVDNSEPPLAEDFWGKNGGAQWTLITVASLDSQLTFAFEDSQPQTRLLNFKPGQSVPLNVTFTGKSKLFSSRTIVVNPQFSVQPVAATPSNITPLKALIQSLVTTNSPNPPRGSDLIVPPLIHPALVALCVLILVICGIIIAISASKATDRKRERVERERRERAIKVEEASSTEMLPAGGLVSTVTGPPLRQSPPLPGVVTETAAAPGESEPSPDIDEKY